MTVAVMKGSFKNEALVFKLRENISNFHKRYVKGTMFQNLSKKNSIETHRKRF